MSNVTPIRRENASRSNLITPSDKVTAAKHIIQAAIAAHDAETLVDENYDIHWTLSAAVDLLEAAAEQMEVQS